MKGFFGGRGSLDCRGGRNGEGGHGFLLLLTVGGRGVGRYDFGHRGSSDFLVACGGWVD